MTREGVLVAGSTRWRDAGHAATVALVLAACVLALVYTFFNIGRPYVGVQVAREGGQWVVQEISASGLASLAGVRLGDVVVSVNGLPVEEAAAGKDFLHHSRVNQVTVVRPSGDVFTVGVASVGFWSSPLKNRIEAIAFTLLGFSFVGLAAWLVIRPARETSVHLLALLSLALGLVLISNQATVRGVTGALAVQWTSMTLAPAFLVQFLYFFPLPALPTWRAIALTLLPYISALGLLVAFIIIGRDNSAFLVVRSLVLLHVLVWSLLAIARAVRLYAMPGLYRFKAAMRVIALVVAAGLAPLLLLYLVPVLAGFSWALPPEVAIVPLATIPPTIAVVASRSELFHYDRIVSRALVHVAIAATVVAAHATLAFVAVSRFGEGGAASAAVAVGIVGLVFVSILNPLRHRLTRLVDRALYRVGQDLHLVLAEMGRWLTASPTAEETAQVVVNAVATALNLEGACLIPEGVAGLRETTWAQGRRRAELQPAMVCQLRVRDLHLGVLLLGPKVSGAAFTREEETFAQAVAGQAALALAYFAEGQKDARQ